MPEIIKVDGKVTLALKGNDLTQTVLGVRSGTPPLLAAVIIYTRSVAAELVVLHMALVRLPWESFNESPGGRSPNNFLELVTAFTKLAKRIAGVKRLHFAYWNLTIPVA